MYATLGEERNGSDLMQKIFLALHADRIYATFSKKLI